MCIPVKFYLLFFFFFNIKLLNKTKETLGIQHNQPPASFSCLSLYDNTTTKQSSSTLFLLEYNQRGMDVV
ncbi:hypothetical protein Hanom_Chr08g00748801 [Helianthus anomalus]